MLAGFGVDALAPSTTPRRVWSLLNRLPPHARTPGEPWADEAHLLAQLIDHVAELTWLTVKIAAPKTSPPRPKPVPRPPRRPVITVALPGQGDRSLPLRTGPRVNGPGPVKHSNWIQAIEALGRMPNVRVERGAGPGASSGGRDGLRAS